MPQNYKPYNETMQDGRRKLTDTDKENIIACIQQGQSQRLTAIQFECSRSTVRFIFHPELYETHKLKRKAAKAHLLYYQKDKHRIAMNKYRAKKRLFQLQFNPNQND